MHQANINAQTIIPLTIGHIALIIAALELLQHKHATIPPNVKIIEDLIYLLENRIN
jgi:hypothetical protein